MRPQAQTYHDELLLALRMRDVPGPQIAEALAEVHSFIADTGEDPREAFGPPRAYAMEVAAALGGSGQAPPFWRGVLTWSTAGYGLAGAAGTWLLLDGVLALAAGRRGALGLPPVALLLLGVAVLVGLALSLSRLARRDDVPVLDPLTGEDMTPPLPRWVLPAMVAAPAASIALAGAVLVLAER